jgi:hypothetical protein
MGANNSLPAAYDAPAYAIMTLNVVLTTAAFGGRMLSRRLMKAAYVTDDYFAYMAYVSTCLVCEWSRRYADEK